MLTKPELDFSGVAGPLLPPDWSPEALATISYGHGLSVSPLMLAQAYTSFANGGEIAPLRLVEPGPFDEIEVRRALSAPSARVVTQMMRAVVTEEPAVRPTFLDTDCG